MNRRWWLLLPAAGAAVVLLAALGVRWQISRVERQSSAVAAKSSQIAFTLLPLLRALPGQVETFSAPSNFSGAAFFQGKLFLCGPGGLFEYDDHGEVRKSYRVGLELPPSPLRQMAVGTLPDAAGQELLISTASEGLLLFDGGRFRQLRPEPPNARALTALLPLSTGGILLGTEKAGLLVFDGRTLSVFHAGLEKLHVTALAGSEPDLWIGTLDRGAIHWLAGELTTLGEAERLPDNQVLSLATVAGRAYVGTPLGVAEFVNGVFSRLLAPGVFARALLPVRDSLLVGTLEDGTLEIPLAARRALATRDRRQPTPARIEQLLLAEGHIYAVAVDGLYATSQAEHEQRNVIARNPSTLTDRNISALQIDSSGRLWVGYFDRGLDIFDPAGRSATHVENEHVFCVNRIVPTDGGMAVGTANGLALFDISGRQSKVLTRADGLISDQVSDIAVTPNLMTLATPAGITQLSREGARSFYAFHGLVNNHAYALGADSSGQMFIGTLGGLSVLQNGLIRASYTTANSGLKHNWISAMVQVGDNDWFVGTYGAGIQRFEPASGRWTTFADATAPFDINPNAMLVTPNFVYAGTLGRGLYVYNRQLERWSSVTNGLPSSNITAVAAGGGYIYVGTDNGLVRFPETGIPF